MTISIDLLLVPWEGSSGSSICACRQDVTNEIVNTNSLNALKQKDSCPWIHGPGPNEQGQAMWTCGEGQGPVDDYCSRDNVPFCSGDLGKCSGLMRFNSVSVQCTCI